LDLESQGTAIMEKQHTVTETGDLQPDQVPQSVDPNAPAPRRRRGFAAMDRKLVSEIARKGGKAAHTAGTAHEFTSEEAREAGRKGGQAAHANRRKAAASEAQPLDASTKPAG
jgi:general stress protein YciG